MYSWESVGSWIENSVRLKFVKSNTILNAAKSFGYIKCYYSNNPTPILKAPAISSDAPIRKSAVKGEDLKPYWKTEKRPQFSKFSTI